MQRLAANDAAERDRTLVRATGALGGIERNRDGGRHFERARNADALEGRARFLQRACSACEQGVGDVLVEARLDDEDARALEIARVAIGRVGGGGAARLGHDPISGGGVVVASGSGRKQGSGAGPPTSAPSAAPSSGPSGRPRD